MAKSVLARILIKNSVQLLAGVVKEAIDCENARVDAMYWLVPVIRNQILQSYRPVLSAAKPTADSVHALRVTDKQSGFVYFIAMADSADATVFTNACNACCDSVTPMPDVVVPEPLLEADSCLDDNDVYNYSYIAPALGAGEVYAVRGSLEGAAFTGEQNSFASVAAFQVWAAANWAAYGTWTNAGQKINLANATKKYGFVKLLRAKTFDSNAPGALTAGQKYVLNVTIDGVVLPTITGVADAALSTIADAANANSVYATYGKWYVVGGAVRLVAVGNIPAAVAAVVTKV